jgi:hypothetical protein
VIQRLPALERGLDEYIQILFGFLLPYVFLQPAGPQAQLELAFVVARSGSGDYSFFRHGWILPQIAVALKFITKYSALLL